MNEKERKKIAHEKWCEKNKEKIREKNKKYYKDNKSDCRLKQTIWRDNNVEKVKENNKKYYENNKDKFKEYVETNKEEISKRRRINYLKNKDRDIKNRKIWYTNNKDKVREYYRIRIKNRRLNDPLFKLKGNIRILILNSFKRNGYTKRSKTHEILDCSFEEFKEHIESQWEPWMDWSNHGKYNGKESYGWDIDHIKPISSTLNEVDVVKLNHFTNLQPLCSKVNRDIKKGNY